MSKFRDLLERVILAQGISKTGLSRVLGVESHTIYSWERGVSKPNEKNMEKLRLVLGEEVDDCFPKEESE